MTLAIQSFKQFRMKFFSLLAILLVALIFFLAPQQVPVMAYKFAVVLLAAVVGYWLDRHLFPYARPDRLDDESYSANAAMLRRAIIVAAIVIGVAIAV